MTEDKEIMYISSKDAQEIAKNTPQKHEFLSDDLIIRIVNFKNILGEADETSIDQTILNFKHDTHPEREVVIWEWIANFYEYINKLYTNLSLEQQKEVLGVALHLSSGVRDLHRFNFVKVLPDEVLKKMLDLVAEDKNS